MTSVMDLTFDQQNIQLSTIKSAHDVAYVFVEQGVCYEEAGKHGEALEMYYKGLKRLNEALCINCDRPYCIGIRWDDARRLQGKMLKIRADVHQRIRVLSTEKCPPEFPSGCSSNGVHLASASSSGRSPFDISPSGASAPPLYPIIEQDTPPSYTEATTTPFQNVPQSGGQVGDMMQCSARLLLRIPSGVQVFHICQGEVTVQSDPTELCIYTLNKAYQPVSPQTVCWVQVSEFTYPLLPGRSPVLKTGYGAYVFPDMSVSGSTNATVALVLSADVLDEHRHQLDSLLEDYGAFEVQPQLVIQPQDATLGQKVSDGIVTASEMIQRGLLRGAQATSSALSFGAEKLKTRLHPEHETYTVDPRLQTGLKVARATTHVACKVSGFVVGVVGDMTAALGHRIAKSIAKPDAIDGNSNSAINEAIIIAGGGLQGFANVFMGLENGAKILAGSITNNTVTLVNHKYGEHAGEVVGDAMYSVGNLALTANNVSNLGVRGIAKRTAKETGKAVLKEYAGQQTTYVITEPPEDEPGPSQNGYAAPPTEPKPSNTRTQLPDSAPRQS